ncbi:uncharacterized protein B0P05DRAFT_541525 [Gilbertella persicaria]|uniref:ASX DEUBAD domain-containing protein n=1 Tax=Rhizopus stolonifer TaxID=4846 RepID=A0A367KIA4_RHIST|nr:uncharacterized protein B0P05DRAFT_541525 [Gilbertella persicaria]KAI8079669.1 hypothetical protein B0P05DRAFT_541525 [Gilbertella persicaria]RCI01964.1 hypothetical protein CU098_011650 [Rhizopus stolonifer]
MYNQFSSPNMMLSPIVSKRKSFSVLENEEHDIALETSQLMICSPNKRPRHEPSWTFDNLCTHPCSPLATIDLESIFNLSTFQLLSQDKREELYSLLPEDQTPLLNHYPFDHEDGYYPTCSDSFIYPQPSFFSKTENPMLWNTLTEWQTMLGQGEFLDHPDSPPLPLSPIHHLSSSSKSSYKTKTPKSSKSSACSLSSHKKDEPFESYWGDLIDKERAHNVAGDSKSITLKDMCRKGLIREQDVIVYKRNFSACKVVVSKSMTVVKACGLSGISIQLDEEIFEDFETPTALETKILDHHGKVTKDKRPNGNAFKSIRLIRAGKDLGRLFDIRKDGFGDHLGC